MAIGNNIRKLRIQKNYSQQFVADTLDIERRTYAAWEDGSREIKSSFIPRLADFFGVEIAELFNGDTNININITDSLKENTNSMNTAVLILTDRDAVDRVLDALKQVKVQ